MKTSFACALLLALACPSAHAIHKCVAKDGKVSYQDAPCPANSTSSPIMHRDLRPHAARVVTVVSGEGGPRYRVGIPGDWHDSIKPAAGGAALRVEATGRDPLVLLMTFFPERTSVGVDQPLLEQMMADIDARHSDATERRAASDPVDLVLAKGMGHLIAYEDRVLVKKPDHPPGEFAIMTTGVLIIEGHVITVTILSNSRNTDAYARALAAIHLIAT